jgi:hypothetical protein
MTTNKYPELKAKEGCCEEASTMSHDFYIPCNRPAVKVLYCDKDKREYRMCDMCAHHNLTRGMVVVKDLDIPKTKPKAKPVSSSKELMIPENITPAIFTDEKKGITELLKSVGTKVVAFKGDISTEEGRKETKDFGKLINRSKTAVDDMGKEHVAKLKELPKQIDAQRKLFRDGMDEYKDQVLKPLTEWQEVEDKRIAKH